MRPRAKILLCPGGWVREWKSLALLVDPTMP
jgi:hypothetical protein